MDVRSAKISNRLIVFGLFMGFVFRFLGEGSTGIVHFLVNISIPVILLFFLFQMRALGAGDIKLFSVAGGFLTTIQLFYLIGAAFVVGAFLGIGKLIYVRHVNAGICGRRNTIHFSIAIIIGYLVVVWGCLIE